MWASKVFKRPSQRVLGASNLGLRSIAGRKPRTRSRNHGSLQVPRVQAESPRHKEIRRVEFRDTDPGNPNGKVSGELLAARQGQRHGPAGLGTVGGSWGGDGRIVRQGHEDPQGERG